MKKTVLSLFRAGGAAAYQHTEGGDREWLFGYKNNLYHSELASSNYCNTAAESG